MHHSDAADTGRAAFQGPAAPADPFPMAETMEPTGRTRRPYAPPRLVVYGRLEELTLTINDNMNKNDPVQGGNNLKT